MLVSIDKIDVVDCFDCGVKYDIFFWVVFDVEILLCFDYVEL